MTHSAYKREGDQAKLLRRRAGAYIKGLRSDAGLTQNELSKRLGLEYYTFISQVEGGMTRVPPESLHTWAEALGVDTTEFAKTLLEFYDPHVYRAIFDPPTRRSRK